MSESDLPNPFECAQQAKGIFVLLQPEDIINVWHSASCEQVEHLFELYGSTIASQMIAAGVNATIEIIQRERGAS